MSGWIVGIQRNQTDEKSSAQPTESHALHVPFTVTITPPSANSQVLFGTTLAVPVATQSPGPADVRRIELWDGDRILSVRSLSGDTSHAAQAAFQWPAARIGSHLLFARAITATKQVSMSAMVPVTVTAARWQLSQSPARFVIPDWVRTARQAATYLGVDADRLVANPDGSTPHSAANKPDAPVREAVAVALPGAPLKPKPGDATKPVSVKVSDGETSNPDGQSGQPTTQPDDADTPPTSTPTTSTPTVTTPTAPSITQPSTPSLNTTAPSTSDPSQPTNPPAPEVTTPDGPYVGTDADGSKTDGASISLSGCNAHVTLTKSRDVKTTVYHGSSGKNWPLWVGEIPAGKTTFEFGPLMPGVQVVVLTTGKGDEKISLPLSVQAPAKCAEFSGWSGDVSIISGVLRLPKAGKGYYLYLHPSSGANVYNTSRIPANPAKFIDASTNKVDIASLIPKLAAMPDLVAELWQASGTSAKLVAKGTLQPPASSTVQTIVGQPRAIDLTADSGEHTVKLTKDREVSFHFEAAQGELIIWQASATPLDANNMSLNPLGVLATGGSTIHEESTKNNFRVNTAKIMRPNASSAPSTGPSVSLSQSSGSGVVQAPAPLDLDAPSGSDVGQSWATPYTLPTGDQLSTATITRNVNELSTYTGRDLWVRAIAWSDDQGAVAISPSVHLDFPPPPAKGPLRVTGIGVDPPMIPNWSWQACAQVQVPWDEPGWKIPGTYGKWLIDLMQTYPHDGSYCRVDQPPPEMSFTEELKAVLIAAGEQWRGFYDVAANTYNLIINEAAALIAKWNPVCDIAGSAKATCQAWTNAIAAAAIKAGLTILGLPPSLPSSEAVIDAAFKAVEGDLSAMAEQWMQQMGVPCDQLTWDANQAAAAKPILDQVGVDPSDPDFMVDGKGSVCRGVATVLLKRIEKVAREAFTSNMSVTLGGPAVPTPVDGLVISPHPYGYWAPYTASITAKATKANLAESFTCTFNVKGWPFYDEATPVTMHHVEGNIWGGTTVIQRREQDRMISYVAQGDEPAWWANAETDGLVDKKPGITFGPNSCTGGKTYTVTKKLKAPPADPVLN